MDYDQIKLLIPFVEIIIISQNTCYNSWISEQNEESSITKFVNYRKIVK